MKCTMLKGYLTNVSTPPVDQQTLIYITLVSASSIGLGSKGLLLKIPL